MEWICEDWTKYRVGMPNSITPLLWEYLSLDGIESQFENPLMTFLQLA